jgi:glycyl-tRNA synthetase
MGISSDIFEKNNLYEGVFRMAAVEKTMDKIVALAMSRGFVFPGSEIYGGFANSWDYGPLGVELKNNVKRAWWKKFIQENPHNVGVDCALMMNPAVWEASGHVSGFNDPLMDCRACKERFRADKLIEEYCLEKGLKENPDGWPNDKLKAFIDDNQIPCPNCKKRDFTDIRQFNMMIRASVGVTEGKPVYLRPETAQGIFVNYKNVQRTTRRKIPFGIGQVGHAFRNEITPGKFIFRTREFEQMELEFFCEPGTDEEWFAYWRQFCIDWLKNLHVSDENLRIRDHSEEELSHYSKATTDIEYRFPFDWGELWGIANRTDYDLKQHMEHSGEDMHYIDGVDNTKRYIPYCVEPSLGLTRMTLAFLCEAYDEEELGTPEKPDKRVVLRFHPVLAPVKAAVLPLSKKLGDAALPVWQKLSKEFVCEFDDAGSIGKRYRRQDEIGTPFCITYDFESENDHSVTVRERDSMKQERVPITELTVYLAERLAF